MQYSTLTKTHTTTLSTVAKIMKAKLFEENSYMTHPSNESESYNLTEIIIRTINKRVYQSSPGPLRAWSTENQKTGHRLCKHKDNQVN